MKKLYYFIFIITILALLLSCIYTPLECETIKGKHCSVIITEPDIPYENYRTICSKADTAYEEVITLTGLDYNQHISIACDKNINEHVPFISYDYYNTIFLSENHFKYYSADDVPVSSALCREITHLLLTAYYGSTDSFFFGEGIAIYIANKKTKPYEYYDIKKELIEKAIRLSYYDVLLENNYEGYYYYQILSADFTAFWCQKFGMQSFYSLYAEVSSNNYKEIIKQISGLSYDDIIRLYKCY